jgi:nicotinamide-nucleotide amidase
MRIDDKLYALAVEVGKAARARQAMIATAESCTGGLVAGALTAVAGSSDWFERGFVTYSDVAKVEQLDVAQPTLDRFGAVSTETALAMARGAIRLSRAQWAVAVTGVAGPGGGSPEKPVGTVCFAWAGPSSAEAAEHHIPGDRAAVRAESVRIALTGLFQRLA